ncbi:MAG: hypothetical protein R3C45_22075 [Phycisphaerales bacterium]
MRGRLPDYSRRSGYVERRCAGYQAGSQGTATITGAGSSRWDINENLLVGKGTGELNISNGGVVMRQKTRSSPSSLTPKV